MIEMSDRDLVDLRRWAVERALGTRLPAVEQAMGLAAEIVTFVLTGPVPALVAPRKYTPGKTQEIWDLTQTGLRPKEIAARLGMTPLAVSASLARERRARGVPASAARQASAALARAAKAARAIDDIA